MQHQHGPDPWRWTALCRNEARLLENVFRAACSTPFFQSIVFKSQEVALANWGLIEASYIRNSARMFVSHESSRICTRVNSNSLFHQPSCLPFAIKLMKSSKEFLSSSHGSDSSLKVCWLISHFKESNT